jgi:hypothetical protein
MTQAFNLSQLANKVNTSGNLDASTALYNQVPVANGGTGKSTVTSGALLVGAGTSAMTELVGSTPGQAVVWNGTTFTTGNVAGAADGINVYVAPGTWTKPSGLLQIKVTVVAAGGNGGSATITGPSPSIAATGVNAGGGGGGGSSIRWIPAPTIPGPVAVTAGAGTNSFGAFCSATAGSAANNASGGSGAPGASLGGAGGSGSGGTVNFVGGGGNAGAYTQPSTSTGASGSGASSILGGGGRGISNTVGVAGGNYGGGGSGGSRFGNSSPGGAFGTTAGGTGAPGVVIVEEFY